LAAIYKLKKGKHFRPPCRQLQVIVYEGARTKQDTGHKRSLVATRGLDPTRVPGRNPLIMKKLFVRGVWVWVWWRLRVTARKKEKLRGWWRPHPRNTKKQSKWLLRRKCGSEKKSVSWKQYLVGFPPFGQNVNGCSLLDQHLKRQSTCRENGHLSIYLIRNWPHGQELSSANSLHDWKNEHWY